MISPMVSTWLIAVIIFFVIVAGATVGVQIWAAFMDRRRGREVETDAQRAHPHGAGDLHDPRRD